MEENNKEQLVPKDQITDLIYEWATDNEDNESPEYEPIRYTKTDTGISFSCLYGDDEHIVTDELIEQLVDEGIKYSIINFGWVYVYICKDNREVAIEWPNKDNKKERQEFEKHLKFVDEVVEGVYYEGWD